MRHFLLFILVFSFTGLSYANETADFLAADKAFQFQVKNENGVSVLHWDIAQGYYLYRHRFSAKDTLSGAPISLLNLPPGETKYDENFGDVQIFHNVVSIPLAADTPAEVTVKWQGCAEAGLCYPPQKRNVSLPVDDGQETLTPPQTDLYTASNDSEWTEKFGGSLWWTVLSFFGAGLLLSLTPCIFPMVPILSGIIVGHGDQITRRKALLISLSYVVAMATSYAIAGIITGMLGANVQAALQNPWVLGGFSTILLALAFSVFGYYDIQLPSIMQTRVSNISDKQSNGLAGAAIMGSLSALIVGPCVAPPLAGALLFIGQTGDAILGGSALFAMGLGMGVPLLAVGASAGSLLPKAGAWMESIKRWFGVIILGMALSLLERLIPANLALVGWAMIAVLAACLLILPVLQRRRSEMTGLLHATVGISIIGYALLLAAGAAVGGGSLTQPLAGLGEKQALVYPASRAPFAEVTTIDALTALQQASEKPVFVDIYADWCSSCKSIERHVLTEPRVVSQLASYTKVKLDVTDSNESVDQWLKANNLVGPPAVLIFPRGSNTPSQRIVGEFSAEYLLKSL